MIRLVVLAFTVSILFVACASSEKRERLQRENPNCTVNDDAELVCPSPFDEIDPAPSVPVKLEEILPPAPKKKKIKKSLPKKKRKAELQNEEEDLC